MDVSKDKRIAHWVRQTLRTGVILSGGIILLGLCIALESGKPRPIEIPAHPLQLLAEGFTGDGTALLYLGLWLLMITPVLRVVILTLGWFVEKDFRFATISLAVLLLLLGSIFSGTR